jgi:hypothetical protein
MFKFKREAPIVNEKKRKLEEFNADVILPLPEKKKVLPNSPTQSKVKIEITLDAIAYLFEA